MNNRILGYTVIAIIVVFLILPIIYLVWQAATPKTIRTIVFEDVNALSFLSKQDPVRIQGVEVGIVRNISIINNNIAHVRIETIEDVHIHSGYSVTVMAKGVMGDRYLTIMPGDPVRPEIPADKLLYGRTAISPDEALSYVGQLQTAIHKLVKFSNQLYRGNQEKRSLVSAVWSFTLEIDTMIRSVTTMVAAVDTSLQQNIDSITALLTTTLKITGNVSEAVPSATGKIATVYNSVDSLLIHVESLLWTLNTTIVHIEQPDFFIWKKQCVKVRENLISLRQVLEMLRGDSLTLPVRLW
jgi:ABC-type transporter Mla subunit MlaD